MFTLSSINHSEINHRDAKGCPSFYQRAQIHWRKFHALNSSFSVSQAVSPYSTMCMTVVVLCSPDAVPTQNLLLNQCPYSSHQELNLTSEFNTLTETMKCHLAAIQTYNNGTLLSAAISQDTQLTLVAPNKRKLTGWEIHYGLISHPLCLSVWSPDQTATCDGFQMAVGLAMRCTGVSLTVASLCATQNPELPIKRGQ